MSETTIPITADVIMLAHLVRDADFATLMMPELGPVPFGEPEKRQALNGRQFVFRALRKAWESDGAMPTFAMLTASVEDTHDPTPEYEHTQRLALVQAMASVERATPSQMPLVVQQSRAWRDKVLAEQSFAMAAGLIDDHDFREGFPLAKIRELAEALEEEAARRRTDPPVMLHDVEDYMDDLFDTSGRLSFGHPILDTITTGGLPTETVSVFAARTNVGKSLMLVHLAAEWMRQGMRVLYIDREMSLTSIRLRLLASVTGTEMKSITDRDAVKAISAKMREYSGEVIIDKDSHTVDEIRTHLMRLRDQHNWVPHVIIVDYITKLDTDRVDKRAGSYAKYRQIARDLKNLSEDQKLRIVTAAQLNRNNEIADSLGIEMEVDLMLRMERDDETDSRGVIRVVQQKTRLGDRSVHTVFELPVRYGTMQVLSSTVAVPSTEPVIPRRRNFPSAEGITFQ